MQSSADHTRHKNRSPADSSPRLPPDGEHLRALFEATQDAILFVDDSGRHLDVNPAACRLFGYARDELLQRTIWDLIPVEQHARANELWQNFLITGTQAGEADFWRQDGQTVAAEYRAVANAMPAVHLTVLRDITERQKAEAALRQSERRLVDAQHLANIAWWEMALATDTVSVSDELYRILGVPAVDFGTSYETVRDYIHPDDRVLADEALQYALHHDEPAEFEIRVVRPGGEMRVLHAQAYAVRDEYGEAVRVLGTLQDVTERWQAQEALRESEQRCRTIYEEAPLGIYLMDLNEHFVRANHAFCAMLGYREEELRGQHIATFNHPDDVPIEVSRLERLLAGELPRYYVQKRYIARDSSVVWANLTANAIHDANGVVLYGISIIEEITAQKRAEIQIEAERRRVAYELHDGLAQIAVSVHQHLQTFATDHPPTSEAARHMLSTILDLAQYTVQEARRLIAGIRPTLLDDFGLGTALRSQVNTLRDEDWTVEYQEALGAVRLPAAVETALFWVAQEALTNIRKHAGVRGAQIMLRREGDSVYLEIRDPGRGFDPATPVPPVKLGEHVGLLGIRERIALLDGTCRIESRPGEGTRIAVTVPFHAVRGNTDG